MEKVIEMTKTNACDFIENIPNGKIFSVVFVKKDGTIRHMNCRKGVKKYLAGGELHYIPSEHGLLPVFDMQIQKYRVINFQTIKEIHFRNEKLVVK
jgi:hypothetical protein